MAQYAFIMIIGYVVCSWFERLFIPEASFEHRLYASNQLSVFKPIEGFRHLSNPMNDLELRQTLSDEQCYALRHVDLWSEYCEWDLAKCNIEGLRRHYEKRPEERMFECDVSREDDFFEVRRDSSFYSTPALVDYKHNRIFCYIAKNSCTMFKTLFAMIRDPEFIPPEIEAKIHRMGNVIDWTSKMSEKKLMEALNSRSWDKVVFLREPLEKLKSAYTNKCDRYPGPQNECGGRKFKDWINFMYRAMILGKICDIDQHFMPQSCWCSLGEWYHFDRLTKWDVFTFVKSDRDLQIWNFLKKYNLQSYEDLFKKKTRNSNSNFKDATNLDDLITSDIEWKIHQIYGLDFEMYEYFSKRNGRRRHLKLKQPDG